MKKKENLSMFNNINVLLNSLAYQKIRHWVNIAEGEVSGLGLISEIKDEQGNVRQLLVEDVFLLKQQCSGVDTLLDDESIGQFLVELVQQGIDTSKVKLWWHSHANMQVFWSGTDEQCIRGLANSSYMVSLVTNKRKDILTRIDVYKPFHITLNKIETDIYHPDNPELLEFCKQEFKAKVIEHGGSLMNPFRDVMIPQRFPGRDDMVDGKVEQLEYLVASGRMSVEEYESKLADLSMWEEMMTE